MVIRKNVSGRKIIGANHLLLYGRNSEQLTSKSVRLQRFSFAAWAEDASHIHTRNLKFGKRIE